MLHPFFKKNAVNAWANVMLLLLWVMPFTKKKRGGDNQPREQNQINTLNQSF